MSMNILKKSIKSGLRTLGYDLRRSPDEVKLPVEFSDTERRAFEYIRLHQLSMVSDERLFATILACKHVITEGIPGDFVECGVFKGGNAIIAKMMFDAYGEARNVWLFDTFRGMTKPSSLDIETATGKETLSIHQSMDRGDHNEWVFCPIEQVRSNFATAGLLDDQVRFVSGDVLETLTRDVLPQTVSVLRLDTDWYASTKIELEVLYPRLSQGGVLIIDDYGCFRGAQKATDEYFTAQGNRPLLNYTDYTGRIGIKS